MPETTPSPINAGRAMSVPSGLPPTKCTAPNTVACTPMAQPSDSQWLEGTQQQPPEQQFLAEGREHQRTDAITVSLAPDELLRSSTIAGSRG